jgi:soluble lytic murein transglycosylase-like protein
VYFALFCVALVIPRNVAHAEEGEGRSARIAVLAMVGTTAPDSVEPFGADPVDISTSIVEAAHRWGVDERILLRIAWCESRWNPQAVGAGRYFGVFQFAPHTWKWVSEELGFPEASPLDPLANVEAAAWLYANHGPHHWGCK